jgi:hypothetical protein
MAMSGTTECARCGGLVNAEGRCSVCGVTQELDSDGGRHKEDSFGGGSARKDSKARPAFLFNKLTNDRFALTQSVSKIGRDQTNNISITNDHYISRHHAWVLQMQGGYWVEDLGSTNGTLLNGEILNERKQIFPGDRLTFGKTELVFVVE